jgi:hypothetical protein
MLLCDPVCPLPLTHTEFWAGNIKTGFDGDFVSEPASPFFPQLQKIKPAHIVNNINLFIF